ncbi:hypothetical protein BpHYR1_020806 [Brachionus plicatilis]|uniref:Uncharacterized protein n=1 Tax=Brachionus plicatilis TaxID=10195 RepID=A0A3M7PVD9_BRAPC|nr:hypothetical protein BpHYR1_020806 [Brachionus plicatilis]
MITNIFKKEQNCVPGGLARLLFTTHSLVGSTSTRFFIFNYYSSCWFFNNSSIAVRDSWGLGLGSVENSVNAINISSNNLTKPIFTEKLKMILKNHRLQLKFNRNPKTSGNRTENAIVTK